METTKIHRNLLVVWAIAGADHRTLPQAVGNLLQSRLNSFVKNRLKTLVFQRLLTNANLAILYCLANMAHYFSAKASENTHHFSHRKFLEKKSQLHPKITKELMETYPMIPRK